MLVEAAILAQLKASLLLESSGVILMTRIVRTLAALGLAAFSLSPIWLQATAAPSMVSGDEALSRVRKLTSEIPWYTSLNHAESIARSENKPIFLVHMLGPLNGMT